MGQKQIKIRDFGEKVHYLINARGSVKLCEDFGSALPKEVPPFTSSKAFAKHLNVNPSYISRDWSDDKNRRSESRLAPQLEHVSAVARLFGIWPRDPQEESNILLFWSAHWKSWYFGDAEEQFTKQYVRSSKGDGRPDSLDAFRKAYCEALHLYIRDPGASPLYFPVIDPKELRDRAARDLAEVIRKAPQVLAHFQQHGGMEDLPFQPQEGVDDAVITIAVEWLLNAPIDIVISACQQAYSQLRGQTEPIAVALLELAQRLVPALYKAHAVSRIRSALGKEIGGLVELPVHHRTVAEVVVAAAEARATAYLPRRKGEKWPVGARSFIDHAPDSGFDADDQKAQDVRDQLAKPFTTASADAIYQAMSAYAAGEQFYRPEPGTNFNDEEKFDLAGEMIRNQMRYDGRSFYMMFYLPKDKDARSKLDDLIKRLAKKLPGMLFLALDDRKSVATAEIRRFDPFVWMLNKAEGGNS